MYINNYTKMDFKCMNNHTFKQSWAELISGSFCKKCWLKSIKTSMTDKIKNFCSINNIKLLSEYEKAKIKMDWKCCQCDKILSCTWDSIRTKKKVCCTIN